MQKTAISMCRVSSDEQAKGYSLDIQKDNIEKYCFSNNIKIISVYKEDHSAKNFNRPEFNKLLVFAKQNKGKVDFLLFTTWDRFSRNAPEAYRIITMLRSYGITPQAIQQPIDFSIPENKIMLAMYLALPEIDNDRRSMKIKEGVHAAIRAGRWCRRAPIGYRNSRDDSNKPIIIPSDKAMYVRMAFELFKKGMSQPAIREEIKKHGFVFSKSALSEILRNPVYIGKIRIEAIEEFDEKVVDGLHQGIVDPNLFYEVQDILAGRNAIRHQPKKTKYRTEFPLRGTLFCEKCGSVLTGSKSKGRSKRYAYYHCHNCNKTRYSVEIVNSILNKILGEIKFKESMKELYIEILLDQLNLNQKNDLENKSMLSKKLEDLEAKISKIQEMLLDDKISPADYSQLKEKIEKEKTEVTFKLSEIKECQTEYRDLVRNLPGIVSNLSEAYMAGDVEEKHYIAGSIFPEKLYFDGNKVRTARINEVIRIMLLNDSALKNKKTGQISKFLDLSGQVEHSGLEPLTSTLPVSRSSQMS